MLSALLLLLAGCLLPVRAVALEPNGSGPLYVGLFPRRDPAITMRLFRPLGKALENALGKTVVLETAPDFEIFKRRLDRRHYDLVHFNQYHYVSAHRDLGYDVLVQNEEFGEASIRGAIYVRADAGINALDQLKGKTILFGGGRRAMMSYIVPTYLLRRAGLGPGDYRERFASSPPNAVLATYLGQADAGGAGELVRRLPMVRNKIDTGKLVLLAVSKTMSHLPWAVKREMDPALQERLRDVLLGLRDSHAGREVLRSAHLTGFNPATDADYDLHREIIDDVEAASAENGSL